MKKNKRGCYGKGGMAVLNQAPELLGSVFQALQGLEGMNDEYSNQPLVNAQTIRNMKTPYSTSMAFGGTIDDLDEDELAQLTEQAEVAGVSVEELFDIMNGPGEDEEDEALIQEEDEDDNNYMPEEETPEEEYEEDYEEEEEDDSNVSSQTFATGGKAKKHWIQKAVNPKHKGYCTPMTKKTCTPRRKALARTFKKHHGFHALGGSVPIEVEDDEIIQTPDGRARKMDGATHEEGGIDMNVPAGTKIYSDRLAIDGKTMQERKAARLKSVKKAAYGLETNPLDPTARNTVARTTETNEMEDAKDMMIQQLANKIYAAPGHKMGGKVKERSYEVGGYVPPKKRRVPTTVNPDYLWGAPELGPTFEPNRTMAANYVSPTPYGRNLVPGLEPTTAPPARTYTQIQAPARNPNFQAPSVIVPEQYDNNPYTVGDYVGIAGNAFNAIAPLVNTRNAMKATKPNRNRYLSFGREALDTNEYAQGQVNAMENADFGELETSTNTARAGNRNSARSVNTIRALDAITNTQRNKARAAISAGAAGRRIGLLGQRSQLQNMRDNAVMRGNAVRDEADKQDIDNYYSNLAANLTNLGTNVQGIGKNLNTAQRNEDTMALLALKNKYGMRLRRKKGQLVTANS